MYSKAHMLENKILKIGSYMLIFKFLNIKMA